MAYRPMVPNWRQPPFSKDLVISAIKEYVKATGGLTIDQISHMMWEWIFGMSEEERTIIAQHNLAPVRESVIRVALNECITKRLVCFNQNKSIISLSPRNPDRKTFDLITVAIKLREKANGDIPYGHFHDAAMTAMAKEEYPLRLMMQDPVSDNPNSVCYLAAISRTAPDKDLMRLEQILLRHGMSEETTVYIATWTNDTDAYIREGRIHLPCYAVTLLVKRNSDLNKVGNVIVETTGEFPPDHYPPDIYKDTQFGDAMNALASRYVSFLRTAVDSEKRTPKLEKLTEAMTALQAEYDNLVKREAQLQAARATGSN